MRKCRPFLVFGGYMDPKMYKRKPGPSHSVEAVRKETQRAMKSMIETAIADPKKLKSQIISYIASEKKRVDAGEIKPGQLKGTLKPIKLALDINEVPLTWKNIGRLFPADRRSEDREYTLEEIRRIIAASSLPLKVVELFMASSGMRIGSFDYLNVGHVSPLESDGKVVCGKVLVYAGEGDDAYETLVTKEAYLAFKDYVKVRKDQGEEVGPNSPLIVIRSMERRMKSKVIAKCVNDVLWKVGLRREKKRRHDVQMNHGFRKYFDNVAKDYIAEDYVEKLIGHDTGTKEHYDRHLPKPLIEQYLKAMPYLEIDPAYRAEAELSRQLEEKKKVHEKEWTELRIENLELKDKQRESDGQMAEMRASIANLKEAQRAEQEKRRKTDRIMNRLFEDPDFRRAVKRSLRGAQVEQGASP